MKKIFILITVFILIFVCSSCTLPDAFLNKEKNSEPKKFEQIEVSDADAANREYNYEFVESKYPDYAENIKRSFIDNADKYNDVFKIINSYRDEKETTYLTYDESLCIIASIRAQEIAETKKYEHNRPYDNGYFSTLFNEYGYNNGKAAENIAWDFDTADAACAAWKNSKSHYENLLGKYYTKTGIGIAQTEDGSFIYVQEFMS